MTYISVANYISDVRNCSMLLWCYSSILSYHELC